MQRKSQDRVTELSYARPLMRFKILRRLKCLASALQNCRCMGNGLPWMNKSVGRVNYPVNEIHDDQETSRTPRWRFAGGRDVACPRGLHRRQPCRLDPAQSLPQSTRDRKSTRLNSSHLGISYAVFC